MFFSFYRCSFGTGEAPQISVEEAGWMGARLGAMALSNLMTFVPYAQPRKQTLKAVSVEDCCEW